MKWRMLTFSLALLLSLLLFAPFMVWEYWIYQDKHIVNMYQYMRDFDHANVMFDSTAWRISDSYYTEYYLLESKLKRAKSEEEKQEIYESMEFILDHWIDHEVRCRMRERGFEMDHSVFDFYWRHMKPRST